MAEETTAVADPEEEEFQFRHRAELESQQPAPPPLNAATMKSGVAEMSPGARSAAQEVVKAAPEALKGAMAAQGAVINPAGIVSEALTPEPVKEFMRTPVVPVEAVDAARQAAQYPIPTLHNILFGTDFKEQGPLATAGRFASEQLAAQTSPENLAIIAGTAGVGAAEGILAKKAPGIAEILFGTREAAPLTAATESVVKPKTEIPVLPLEDLVARRDEYVARGAPPSEIAKLDEAIRQSKPDAPERFPVISQSAEEARRATRTVETGVQSETARIGEPNSSEITKSESVTQPEVRTSVGENAPLRQQGETPEARQGVEAQTQAKEVAQPVSQPGQPTGSKPVPAETPLIQTSDEPHVSRIANRFTEERSAQGEIGEIAPGQGFSTQELVQRGQKMQPEEVNQHVSDLMQGTGDIVKQGQAVRAEEARLSQRSAQLSKAADANPNDIEAKVAADNAFKDLTDFHNGPVAQLKNKWHATGMEMQGEIPVDLSSYNGLREAWLRDTGELPPAKVEGELRRTAKNVSDSIEAENGSMKKLGEEIGRQSASRKLPEYDKVRDNIRERMGLEPCAT